MDATRRKQLLDAAERANEETASVIDLGGISVEDAIGHRLEVSYEEHKGKDTVTTAYRGSVVRVDLHKGLNVKFDGYARREWVTDEDEWKWLVPAPEPEAAVEAEDPEAAEAELEAHTGGGAASKAGTKRPLDEPPPASRKR